MSQIQLLCGRCDSELEVVYWTLGNDCKMKITPCNCASEEEEELREQLVEVKEMLQDVVKERNEFKQSVCQIRKALEGIVSNDNT